VVYVAAVYALDDRVRESAAWVVGMLRERGLQSGITETM
jgi:hypothetical protein